VLTPTPTIDLSKFPTADNEYTPQQRRMIDAEIAEGMKGPWYGPFKDGHEVAAFLKEYKSKQAKAKKTA
jgi:hypothetical protein